VNRRERPPRAAAAAPAADGALGYCLPPPAGLNKEEAASCRFTNVQSPVPAPQAESVAGGLMKYMPDRLMTTDWIGGPPDWSSDATGPRR
ncbi:MAG TPA: hypothetical protein VMW38_25630, partial [Terriglobia bacterium]|nr:hypothetical protein [Terriglobia bacterium]